MAETGNSFVSFQVPSGCGSLVVEVTDLWLESHEFEPSSAEDPPCRGGRCTLNLSRLKHPPAGVVRSSTYLTCISTLFTVGLQARTHDTSPYP
ncbi:hypothetical protein TNCV_4296051 [Trichonephila clavipes]|nr:hypothetical protein TNCV_4296051 [Trichonephila clavipes]